MDEKAWESVLLVARRAAGLRGQCKEGLSLGSVAVLLGGLGSKKLPDPGLMFPYCLAMSGFFLFHLTGLEATASTDLGKTQPESTSHTIISA